MSLCGSQSRGKLTDEEAVAERGRRRRVLCAKLRLDCTVLIYKRSSDLVGVFAILGRLVGTAEGLDMPLRWTGIDSFRAAFRAHSSVSGYFHLSSSPSSDSRAMANLQAGTGWRRASLSVRRSCRWR